jgi:hypothetical protein
MPTRRGVRNYPNIMCIYAAFSPRTTEFVPRAIHVRFMVIEVARRQVFLRVLRFFPVSIILPLLNIVSYVVLGIDKVHVRDPVPQRHSVITVQQ